MIDKGFVLVAALALLAVSLTGEAQPAGTVRTIGIIGHTPAESFRREAERAAQAKGVRLLAFEVSAPDQIESVIATVAKARPDAFVAAGDPLFWNTQQRLIEAVARHRLPTIWEYRTWVEAGGLMSYGANPDDLYCRAATYADRILKGTKPADLPIDQATKFELAINLTTARTLDITISLPCCSVRIMSFSDGGVSVAQTES